MGQWTRVVPVPFVHSLTHSLIHSFFRPSFPRKCNALRTIKGHSLEDCLRVSAFGLGGKWWHHEKDNYYSWCFRQFKKLFHQQSAYSFNACFIEMERKQAFSNLEKVTSSRFIHSSTQSFAIQFNIISAFGASKYTTFSEVVHLN